MHEQRRKQAIFLKQLQSPTPLNPFSFQPVIPGFPHLFFSSVSSKILVMQYFLKECSTEVSRIFLQDHGTHSLEADISTSLTEPGLTGRSLDTHQDSYFLFSWSLHGLVTKILRDYSCPNRPGENRTKFMFLHDRCLVDSSYKDTSPFTHA